MWGANRDCQRAEETANAEAEGQALAQQMQHQQVVQLGRQLNQMELDLNRSKASVGSRARALMPVTIYHVPIYGWKVEDKTTALAQTLSVETPQIDDALDSLDSSKVFYCSVEAVLRKSKQQNALAVFKIHDCRAR